MQESLENSNILMYSTHNEGKSVTVYKNTKGWNLQKMTDNDSKYLIFLIWTN